MYFFLVCLVQNEVSEHLCSRSTDSRIEPKSMTVLAPALEPVRRKKKAWTRMALSW